MSLDISLSPSLLAPVPRRVRCPKCGSTRTARDPSDRDYIYCVACFCTSFIGVAMGIPENPNARPGGIVHADGVPEKQPHLYSVRVERDRELRQGVS